MLQFCEPGCEETDNQGEKISPMGNGLVLYQGALLHEQFVALVTLEPLESICCYISQPLLIERELTSAQV